MLCTPFTFLPLKDWLSSYMSGELLVPPHASLYSWHSVHNSLLDSLHRLQHWKGSPSRPEYGPHWPYLPGRPPAHHRHPRTPGGRVKGPANPGSLEACERLLPAGIRHPTGQQNPRLPAVFDPCHKRKLLYDFSQFEWRAGEGKAVVTNAVPRELLPCMFLAAPHSNTGLFNHVPCF